MEQVNKDAVTDAVIVGARLMTTLLSVLEQTGGRYGLQTMREAGDLANATVIERL